MQRERGGRDNSNSSNSPLDKLRGMISRIFGVKDPCDEPSLPRPSENSSESSRTPAGDTQPVAKSKGPVIVELDTEDELEEEERGVNGSRMNRDEAQANAWTNANPLVEHPDDQPDGLFYFYFASYILGFYLFVHQYMWHCAYLVDHNMSKSVRKAVVRKTREKKNEGTHAQTQGVSYRRVTHGGINGAYYTATTTRRTGSDGMVLEDSKQADATTGQATHRTSRGIHDKGYSLTRKLDSDGKVNAMQTLHNIEEDELAGFEQTWKGNADKHLPSWNSGFEFHANTGTSNHSVTNWNPQFREPFRGLRPNSNAQAEPLHGRPKKVVTINIE